MLGYHPTTEYPILLDAELLREHMLEQTMKSLATEDYEYRAALHLAFIVKSLSQFQQLNMSPRFDGNHPALQHAIHVPDVVRQIALSVWGQSFVCVWGQSFISQ